jgi:hypothetical protein
MALNVTVGKRRRKERPMKPELEVRRGMAIRTGAELQAARKAAAERFQATAMQCVPDGYTIEYHKSLSGRHYGKRKLIQAPRPSPRDNFFTTCELLHRSQQATAGIKGKKRHR